jgi:hypothetical protein
MRMRDFLSKRVPKVTFPSSIWSAGIHIPAWILIVNPEHNNSHHHFLPSEVSPFGDKKSNSNCFWNVPFLTSTHISPGFNKQTTHWHLHCLPMPEWGRF